MKAEELAFANQQLAGLIRGGLPLEGALRQLCDGMARGPFKDELLALETDLATGKPLAAALQPRALPDFYKRLLEVGARANNLPVILNLLADHYGRASATWERLRALLLYPALVLGLAFLVSVGLGFALSEAVQLFRPEIPVWYLGGRPWGHSPMVTGAFIWLPTIVLGGVILLCAGLWYSRTWRDKCEFLLPGFKDSRLAQLASALAVLLQGGVPLPEALALLESLEHGEAAKELAAWRGDVAAGKGPLPGSTAFFPPLFRWSLGGGDDPVAGLRRAAEIYFLRARYQMELLLHAVLPVCLVLLGGLLVSQAWPAFRIIILMLDMFGAV